MIQSKTLGRKCVKLRIETSMRGLKDSSSFFFFSLTKIDGLMDDFEC